MFLLQLVVKYIEDAGPEATTGHEFYTLIPDLDYLPKERRLCNDEGQGHTLIFGKEGGWEKENEQVKRMMSDGGSVLAF